MNNKPFIRYYLFACIGILLLSFYPLSMGIRVIRDMVINEAVLKENYPKYIIPYTPIAVSVLLATLLIPLCLKLFRRFALVGGSGIAVAAFFGLEWLFEQKVVVTSAETVVQLENWQMYMCYVPPEGWGETVTTYKTQTAVDILMGNYSPAFKLHFYLISLVLILTILNVLYGFAQMIRSGDRKRLPALAIQSVCTAVFLGLCILACFTAFWRDGSIRVSPLSACLMSLFFILLGVSTGVFFGSFLLDRSSPAALWLPALVSSGMTFLMYIGEMCLLNGHLYRFGTGFLFTGIPGIVFAPIDLLVVLSSGGICAGIFKCLRGRLPQ